jgi:hypothetical protein
MNVQDVGALTFGIVIGWFAYYVNRYRSDTISISDVGAFIAAIGGAAVLALFPAGSELFGYYGLGLGIGFFVYFLLLLVFVLRSPGFTLAFFLDGRAPALAPNEVHDTQHPMLHLKDTPEDEAPPA